MINSNRALVFLCSEASNIESIAKRARTQSQIESLDELDDEISASCTRTFCKSSCNLIIKLRMLSKALLSNEMHRLFLKALNAALMSQANPSYKYVDSILCLRK